MEKIIIEVGSTVTKVDKCSENKVERLLEKTIFFKKHYLETKKISEEDFATLISLIQTIKKEYVFVYVCGTSIFRNLKDEEQNHFLKEFKKETNLDFHIISQERESELTVLGVTRNIKEKVCVFIGGGGSTEIAVYNEGIVENVNTSLGVIDILNEFPGLADDFSSVPLKKVVSYCKENIKMPKERADILILAGGGQEKFARESGILYEENKIYQDPVAPIMMDIGLRKKETDRYFRAISLEEIKKKAKDSNWWEATRAMCACVLAVAESIEAKYVIPTNVGMVYGIIKELEIKEKMC